MRTEGSIIKATSADAFYAGLVKDETPALEVLTGTVTLVNGYKRRAEWMIGSLTGKRLLQYKTPAGRWRNPTPAEVETFTPDPS